MHLFKNIAGVALLLAAAEATPIALDGISANEATPAVVFKAKRESINDCGDSTFVNQSSGGSPKISDCQQIAANIAGGGSWTILTSDQHQLVQYGTCAFGVTTEDLLPALSIGNQDIIDLINSSIQKFSWNGLVGARGQMACRQGQVVFWGLYHT